MLTRLLLCLALALAPGAFAQNEIDDILGDFEDEDAESEVEELPEIEEPSFWEMDGSIQLDTAFRYAQKSPGPPVAGQPGPPDYRGLSRLRAQLSLELDLQLNDDWEARIAGRGFRDYAYANERSDYTDDVLDRYQHEIEFQELWIRGRLRKDLDVKFGRQIVVWGRSDNLRVLDVMNPLDNRVPGLVAIAALRLPVTMTRLDYYKGPWSLTGIAVHESRFDERPVFNQDLVSSIPPGFTRSAVDITRANGGRDTEWAVALQGIFTGWDLSFHWARFFDDRGYLSAVVPPVARLDHSRLNLWGASTNVAFGNWLFKTEGAYLSGLEFFNVSTEKARSDVMVGVEYSGINDMQFALEVANRHMHGYHSALGLFPDFQERDRVELAFRYSGDFRHQTGHLTLVALVFGWRAEDGSVFRGSIEYDVFDAFSVTGGVLVFEPGNCDQPQVAGADRGDRIFFNMKYSF